MNEIRKIRRGDDLLEFLKRGDFREGWNLLVDIAQWWREFVTRREDSEEDMFAHPAVVDVANRTGAVLEKYSIVQLGGPLIDPTLNLLSFQQSPGFMGIIPTSPPDLARFAVMLEPLAPGASGGPYLFGRAVVAGAVAVHVNVSNLLHGFAIPIGGSTSALQSTSASAGAVILTRPVSLGLQWLYVALGRCCALNFASMPGSSQGGAGYVCCGNQAYCVRFPGITGSGCSDLASPGINLSLVSAFDPAQCYYEGTSANGLTFRFGINEPPLGPVAYPVQLAVLLPPGGFGGLLALYNAGTPGTPINWDCASPLVLSLASGSGSSPCGNWPATITVLPSPCSGGGGGGGGGTDCSVGNCGDAGVPATTTATVTAATGSFAAFPSTIDYACANNAIPPNGFHQYAQSTSSFTAFGQTQGTVISVFGASPSTTPIWIYFSSTGHSVQTEAQPGWTCNPYSAVFNVTDPNDGSTCTVTVVSP